MYFKINPNMNFLVMQNTRKKRHVHMSHCKREFDRQHLHHRKYICVSEYDIKLLLKYRNIFFDF